MNTSKLFKFFLSPQIRTIDEETVKREGISSFDLMERAASVWVSCFMNRTTVDRKIFVACGPGNNGGDGLAISRMLSENGYDVTCVLFSLGHKLSKDTDLNVELIRKSNVRFTRLEKLDSFSFDFSAYYVIIDALFGTGIDRPIEGDYCRIVNAINDSYCKIVSVDIPSGLFPEDNSNNIREAVISANETYTFQFPKLAFLFPENGVYVGNWRVLNINLDRNTINALNTKFYGLTEQFIKSIVPKARNFSHKGMNGRVAVIAGHSNMVGAAILATMGAVRSGVGLVYSYFPAPGLTAMLSLVPEAIPKVFGTADDAFSDIMEPDQYRAIAIGPGLGTKPTTADGLLNLFKNSSSRLVIDADAINIIAENPDILEFVSERAILTPHLKEFERLVGKWDDDFDRLNKLMNFAAKYRVCVVLKDAYSVVALPDGTCFFNPTGNPGMSKGGAGDVLTGVILAMAAQRMPIENAALIGVYVHGLAGDIMTDKYGIRGYSVKMLAENLGLAWKKVDRLFIKPKW